MKKFTFHCPDSSEEKRIMDWLKEVFLDELNKLGFRFEKYAQLLDEDTSSGCHVIKMVEQPEMNILSRSRVGDYEALCQICTQDDDNQPAATFQLHLGTLWLFIPFNA